MGDRIIIGYTIRIDDCDCDEGELRERLAQVGLVADDIERDESPAITREEVDVDA